MSRDLYPQSFLGSVPLQGWAPGWDGALGQGSATLCRLPLGSGQQPSGHERLPFLCALPHRLWFL